MAGLPLLHFPILAGDPTPWPLHTRRSSPCALCCHRAGLTSLAWHLSCHFQVSIH